MTHQLLRQLPSVSHLLQQANGRAWRDEYPAEAVTDAVRAALEDVRQHILSGRQTAVPTVEALLDRAGERLRTWTELTLHPVINATGIIIHTNLGRATLSEAAQQAVTDIGGRYATLEYNIEDGKRGKRDTHPAALIRRLTGTEDALVVNNAAAAVFLKLSALCTGREVIISRGQLIEIGGGFRIPDIMAQSGCKLVEVGTTNRTHLRDYANAINENTAAIMVAHYSNFQVVGFTTEPSLEELAQLAHDHHLPLLYDQGSGCMLDTAVYGLRHERTVPEAVAAGCDLLAFSGDKLLGGPQAGILCGRKDLIHTLKKHPLARALRPDKLCLAALTATLRHYLRGEAESEIPVWRMMGRTADELAATATKWVNYLHQNQIHAHTTRDLSAVGGGSLPGTTLPTTVVAFDRSHPHRLAEQLRRHPPHIIARIKNDQLLLDPRTVLPDQVPALLEGLVDVCANEALSDE